MSYQLDTARATIDERLREAQQHRLVRAARRENRTQLATQRVRRALTNPSA